jgi:hypothetical protein
MRGMELEAGLHTFATGGPLGEQRITLSRSTNAQRFVVARIGFGRSGKRPARARLGVAYPRDLLGRSHFACRNTS